LRTKSGKIKHDFPLGIKPVDSQGQWGVFLVKDNHELEKKIIETLQFSKNKRNIVEEFLAGMGFSEGIQRG